MQRPAITLTRCGEGEGKYPHGGQAGRLVKNCTRETGKRRNMRAANPPGPARRITSKGAAVYRLRRIAGKGALAYQVG